MSGTIDPRWAALQSSTTRCPACGIIHQGVFDLAIGAPNHWTDPATPRSNEDLDLHGNFLSSDFCVLGGEDFFIRCVLEIPLLGTGDPSSFAFGVWASLSEANFHLYLQMFDQDDPPLAGPWFGWFCNRLLGYPDTLGLKTLVHPRGGGQRPTLQMEPTDHPLAQDQRHGMSFDRLMEVYSLNGHRLAPADLS